MRGWLLAIAVSLGLWLAPLSSAVPRPTQYQADEFCSILPLEEGTYGSTEPHAYGWHCVPDRYDPLIGEWLYNVWVTQRYHGIVKHFYLVVDTDGNVMCEMHVKHGYPEKGGVKC